MSARSFIAVVVAVVVVVVWAILIVRSNNMKNETNGKYAHMQSGHFQVYVYNICIIWCYISIFFSPTWIHSPIALSPQQRHVSESLQHQQQLFGWLFSNIMQNDTEKHTYARSRWTFDSNWPKEKPTNNGLWFLYSYFSAVQPKNVQCKRFQFNWYSNAWEKKRERGGAEEKAG